MRRTFDPIDARLSNCFLTKAKVKACIPIQATMLPLLLLVNVNLNGY